MAFDKSFPGTHDMEDPVSPSPPTSADLSRIDQFFRQDYSALRRIAHSRLRRSESITLLDTTSLVHECYMRIQRAGQTSLHEESQFLAYAASVMRSVIVDFVRRRRTERRGAGEAHVSLDATEADEVQAAETEILDVSDALDLLAGVEPRLAHVVEMRYFGGFTDADIAKSLGLTDRTVRRDWEKAKLLLRAVLSPRD